MRNDWLLRFRHFSLSIDTVDEENYRRIQQSLKTYLCKSLGASFFRVLVDGFQVPIDGALRPCLTTVWAEVAKGHFGDQLANLPVLDAQGQPFSQSSYAYFYREPLWINASDESDVLMTKPKRTIDSWSKAKHLPAYRDYGRGDSRTSILLPLEYDFRLFGVLNLEFRERLSCNEPSKLALRMLATSLARIVFLHQSHRSRKRSTNRAFEQLESLDSRISSPLEPRTIFLASSSRADREVMEILRRVLGSYKPLLLLQDWAEQASSGSISDQIARDIRSCEFGVCYLSELPAEGTGSVHSFLDNPNVLFEAGMMQMLTELQDPDPTEASRWIPVREDHRLTSAAPFDFAGERMVIVPRDPRGALLKEELEESVESAVQAQISDLSIR